MLDVGRHERKASPTIEAATKRSCVGAYIGRQPALCGLNKRSPAQLCRAAVSGLAGTCWARRVKPGGVAGVITSLPATRRVAASEPIYPEATTGTAPSAPLVSVATRSIWRFAFDR